MIEMLRTYNTQFGFVPEVVNDHLIKKNYKHIILCGMGGSHLPVGLLKTIQPGIDIYVHRDYDLPPFEKSFFESALLVASSFSGNTAEVISFYKKAKQLFDLPVLCIATGGELLDLAKRGNDPYITLPQSEFVPRTALGITTIALASVLKEKSVYQNLTRLSVDIAAAESEGESLSDRLGDKTPIFYASSANLNLAYNWKIKCNETGKIHAFYNVFPEANHNELEAYEYAGSLSGVMPIILRDSSDDARIQKRFDVFQGILSHKGVEHAVVDISNPDIYRKVFQTIVLGDFFAASVAQRRRVPQASVPLIEEFKKRLI
jgi:glucose/mannose-6-phosphate isomerase